MGERGAPRPIAEGAWRRASRCQSGECLEVCSADDWVAVRDSNYVSVVVKCSAQAWQAFTTAIKTGEFDDLI
jgi:hypothetical protein